MYFKILRGGDALAFTTKFRNFISKALLRPPHLYGSVAMPHLAENTQLPVSAQAHHSKDRWGKHVPSNTEKWRRSSSLPASPAHNAEHPGSWSCLLHCWKEQAGESELNKRLFGLVQIIHPFALTPVVCMGKYNAKA